MGLTLEDTATLGRLDRLWVFVESHAVVGLVEEVTLSDGSETVTLANVDGGDISQVFEDQPTRTTAAMAPSDPLSDLRWAKRRENLDRDFQRSIPHTLYGRAVVSAEGWF